MTTGLESRTVAAREALALRRRVHDLLEDEYLRLRGADRPELLMMSAARVEDGVDPDALIGELEIVDGRIAALDRHFAALAADPSGPAHGRVYLLDLGEGPQLMLWSQIELADDQVVAADSPLGRTLRDAAPGQVLTYPRPRGLGWARVLDVERAERAELLVVGRGSQADNSLGPIAHEVMSRTSRATVVVPSGPEPDPHNRVVVGLRESWHAADAMSVGFAEANRRGASLVVTVIRDARADDTAGGGLEPVFHPADDGDAAEAEHLPLAVAAAGRAFPDVVVTTQLRTGHFAEVVVELSQSADLVVLGMGERPTGMGRKDLLIASHSVCPVIVVRESSYRGGA